MSPFTEPKHALRLSGGTFFALGERRSAAIACPRGNLGSTG
jgi:hypothetical protein